MPTRSTNLIDIIHLINDAHHLNRSSLYRLSPLHVTKSTKYPGIDGNLYRVKIQFDWFLMNHIFVHFGLFYIVSFVQS